MVLLDNALSKIDPSKAMQIVRDNKATAPALQPFHTEQKKRKPLNRHQNDELLFQEIFVQPKEELLRDLKQREKNFENLFFSGTQKQYDKILQVDTLSKAAKKKPAFGSVSKESPVPQRHLSPGLTASKSSPNPNLKLSSVSVELKEEKSLLGSQENGSSAGFFNQQIQVQAPDLPNASIASPLAPGLGYAPSIPITKLAREKTNLKDLLIRANANLQEADLQKEAHLSFYLAYVYENKKMYRKAIKFYKRYYNCAKGLEDKIGMALTMNRIGLCYHNLNNHEKSISYHLKNMELSDDDNSFACYYNLGISFRILLKFPESLEYFTKGLAWAEQKKDDESRCLIYGQMGVTHLAQKSPSSALEFFEVTFLPIETHNSRASLLAHHRTSELP